MEPGVAGTTDRPNLLVLIADQMRADVLGCNGSPVCRTPTLDTLAADGVTYSQAYTVTPLCTPARASLLTGRFPHSHRLVANTQYPETPTPRLPEDERLVSEYLDDAGYRCGWVGKWHLNVGDEKAGARERGFADFLGTKADYQSSLAVAGTDPSLSSLQAAQRTMRGAHPPMSGTSPLTGEETYDGYVAAEASSLLRRYHEDGRGGPESPFALWCSLLGPHFPWEVPAPYDQLYDPAMVPRPASFDDTFAGKPQGQRWHPWLQLANHLSWPEWQQAIARYWGYVTYIDALVGRVLATLDEVGLRERTVVLFVSDHGEMAGHHRMFDKGPYLYEDVMHIPCLWRWPGSFPAGRVADDGFVSLVDLAPTLCDLAGATPSGPQPFQGRSLVRNLHGGNAPLATEVFAETNPGDLMNPQLATRMVRRGQWKYVFRPGDVDELYDLAADPDELVNRIADARVVRRELWKVLGDWMKTTDDPQSAGIERRGRFSRMDEE